MINRSNPHVFQRLISNGGIRKTDMQKTPDGFFIAYKSLSDILLEKGIVDFPDSEGERLSCDKFFDDWYLYAVPDENDYTYSLLKLREQEHDAEEGLPADGDTPGVTVSFIAFDYEILLGCLADPTDENRKILNREINRVVAHKGQCHHKALKKYFVDPKSQGAYLVADLYARHIAALAREGWLEVPACYKEIFQKSISYKQSSQLARLPRFIKALNQKAGDVICDHEKIYISNPKAPSEYEMAAILATHTGNTSVYSFAAEVEYHARFLIPLAKIRLPFYGRSIYDSAIRADMTIGDKEFEGPAPFHQDESNIVKRQYVLHQAECFVGHN